jgi:hypothetical protein
MALTEDRPKAEYKCTQQELYQVCLLTWDSYLENVADFTSENTTYTLLFGQQQRQAVLDAKKMPDFQQRDEASETAGILLKEGAEVCLIKWQSLEGYIKKAFAEKFWKAKLEAAGSTHYGKAADFNWEEVSALMESGKKFIDDHTAVLTSPGGMPGGFAGATGAFETARTAFQGLYGYYKDAQQDNEELADDKIKANNVIFRAVTLLNEDGQKIYRKNAAKRERFTFSSVLELVSGAGATTKTVVIAPATTVTVDKVRANSPITNTAAVPIVVSAGVVAATSKPSSVILNPDDVIPNTFGASVKFENQDAVTAAECTVRVTG